MIDMERVPWISKEQIEERAEQVFVEARRKLGTDIAPPVPIEAIIEQAFGLHLLVEDLAERYSHLGLEDDLLGASVLSLRQVLVHEKLLHDPKNQGRYFFTCAHELAHWVLHRPLYQADHIHMAEEKSALAYGILCRVSGNRARGERQADFMAACLLMPKVKVREAFRKAISDEPIVFVNRESSICRKGRPLWLEPALSHAPFYAEKVIEAGNFTNVSKAAMCVRLEELGLFVNAVDKPWVAL